MESIIKRATVAFSQIKDAMVFPFNMPAIIELGTATGFDFELIDRGGLGHTALTRARNQLLGMVKQHPDQLVRVRPNGLEDTLSSNWMSIRKSAGAGRIALRYQ